MAEDLTTLWTTLSLIEKEKDGVFVGDTDVAQTLSKRKHCLIWKLITERVLNRQAFKLTMSKVWN